MRIDPPAQLQAARLFTHPADPFTPPAALPSCLPDPVNRILPEIQDTIDDKQAGGGHITAMKRTVNWAVGVMTCFYTVSTACIAQHSAGIAQYCTAQRCAAEHSEAARGARC